MFIRVKSKITGHEFDIHEAQFDEGKHALVDKRRYPPSKRVRRTKFRVRNARALSVSTKVEKGATDVASNSEGD